MNETRNQTFISSQARGGPSDNGKNGNADGGGDEPLDGKMLAKRKMLGNIKFIGELGKLQIVHDSILHRCCEQLLVGRRKQPLPDQAEDLECLCHLMKTCGRILDTTKGKALMDQYFMRLQQHADSEVFPVRIRFLIQDIIELRKNKWLPRKIGKAPEGPRTIQQVREDAYRDGCIFMPQRSSEHRALFFETKLPEIAAQERGIPFARLNAQNLAVAFECRNTEAAHECSTVNHEVARTRVMIVQRVLFPKPLVVTV